MRHTGLAALAMAFAAAAASAQTATPLRQASLRKWGVPPANYSGISHIGGNSYAVVSDKEERSGFYVMSIDIDTVRGRVAAMRRGALLGAAPQAGQRGRDEEGVCFYPKAGTVFISAEDDQQVLEYSMDGTPTGRGLQVPAMFAPDSIFPNFGFESLAYDTTRSRFYTATERPLRSDMADDSLKIRILEFNDSLALCGQHLYRLEPPALRRQTRFYAHGISEIAALPGGRLVVMEREVSVPRKYLGGECRIRLFVVDPSEEVSAYGGGFLSKTAIADFSTHLRAGRMNFANYEGMCPGPRLRNGRQTLILISDSQGGMGNKLYHLKDYVRLIEL